MSETVSFRESALTWLSVFAFLCLVQAVLFFVRAGWFYETDPFFLAEAVRAHVVPAGYAPLFFWLAWVFPWNLLVVWFLPCFFTATLALEAGLICSLYANGKKEGITLPSGVKQGGWMKLVKQSFVNFPIFWGAVLCFGMPAFIFRGLMFEEDFLGLVFLFASLYFALRFIKEREEFCFWWHLAFFALALFTWWRGSLLFAPLFALLALADRRFVLWVLPVVGAVAGLLVFGVSLPVPNFVVWEDLPGILTLPSAFLFCLVGLYALWEVPRSVQIVSVYCFLLACYEYRFAYYAFVPLAVLCYFYLSPMPWEKTFRFWKWSVTINPLQFFLQVMLVSGLIAGAGGLVGLEPTQHTMESLKEVVGVTGSELVANEWSYGHWISWLGGNPEFTPLSHFDYLSQSQAKWLLGNCSLGYPVEKNFTTFCLMKRATQ